MSCKACHQDHSPMLRCEVWKRQQLASNNNEAASNNASNAETTDGSKRAEVSRGAVDSPGAGVQVRGGSAGERNVAKKQRWSKEAYNAYQREYMRKRRERLAG